MATYVRRGVVADFGDENAVRDRGDDDGKSGGKQPNSRVHGGDALNSLEPDGKEINYVVYLVSSA